MRAACRWDPSPRCAQIAHETAVFVGDAVIRVHSRRRVLARPLLPAVAVFSVLALCQAPTPTPPTSPVHHSSALLTRAPAASAARAGIPDGDGMELSRTSRPVAPGTRLTSFQRLESDKWLRADALSVELGSGRRGTRADYLSSGKVSTRKTVSEHVKAHDPGKGRRTVAALNADFFDINETGAPLGPGVRDGRVTHSPAAGNSESLGVGPEAAGRVLDLYFEGTLTLPDGEEPLTAYNAANVPENGIGAYNSQWGRGRSRPDHRPRPGLDRGHRCATAGSSRSPTSPARDRSPRAPRCSSAGTRAAKRLDSLEKGDRGLAGVPRAYGRRQSRAAHRRRRPWTARRGRPAAELGGEAEQRRGAAHRGRLLQGRLDDARTDRGRPAGGVRRRHAHRTRPDDEGLGRPQRPQPGRRRLLDPAGPRAGQPSPRRWRTRLRTARSARCPTAWR